MADAVILAGGDPRNKSATAYFYMDATKSVTPQFSSSISSYPVQRSSNVSDNVVINNTIIQLEGSITNHFLPQEVRYGAPQESQDIIGFSTNRVTKAINILRDYQKNKKFITLVLEHGIFENCLIREFSAEFTVTSSDSLDVKMTLEQVRIATAEKVLTFDVIDSKKSEAVTTKGGGTVSKEKVEGDLSTDEGWDAAYDNLGHNLGDLSRDVTKDRDLGNVIKETAN